jgi:hypothetical protein
MDVTTLQNQLTAMRTGDGELERRLSELDAKLGAWLDIVQAGHAALLQLARKLAPSAVPPAAQVPLVEPVTPSASERPPSPPSPSPSTDETLLQTLDHETAQAIRVRRRLTHDSRSVQQLLEEHRAAQQQQQQAKQQSQPAARRGWWRRKDD